MFLRIVTNWRSGSQTTTFARTKVDALKEMCFVLNTFKYVNTVSITRNGRTIYCYKWYAGRPVLVAIGEW